jgi:transposase InsO family protein
VTVLEQRLEFCRLADAGGVSFAELCRRFGVKRDTGYKWWARWQEGGEAGLEDRPRTPHHQPARTQVEVEELICGVREKHAAWGGRKIRGFLLRQGHEGVPAASTITQILRRNQQVAGAAPQRGYRPFERPEPNDLWQMDFKGSFPLADGQPVHTLGVLDDHSRFSLCLAACPDQQTATVKALLVATFRHYGLPQAILCDNGSPWGNDWGQPWTPLTVWLTDLGVRPVHSRPRHPQTAGKEERFHRTLDLEVIHTRPHWDSYPQVQDAYDRWRPIYNHHRPHQSLGETVVPADRYQPSPRPYPEHVPPPDYPDGSDIRTVGTCGRFSWRGKLRRAGRAFAGKRVAVRPTTTDDTYTVYYRHHPIRTINLSTMSPNTRPPSPRS